MSTSDATPPADLPPVKVSVCIPTYNGQDYVAQAVESVLGQTYGDFELLLVDDNSTDATPDILRSFTDPRVRVHQNGEQRGIPGNWNRCLELARGEHLCIFHQDDLMRPENLAEKVRVLDADPQVSFVYSAAEALVESSAPPLMASWSGPEDFVMEGPDYFRRLLFHGNTICCPSVVVRRKRLLEIGGFNEQLHYACDYETWLRLSVEGRVAFLERQLIRYRWHAKNASHAFQGQGGDEEISTAWERAVLCYVERTGRQQEGAVLREALAALAVSRRWAAHLQQQQQPLKAWVGELEKAKTWWIGQFEGAKAQLRTREQDVQDLHGHLQERDRRLWEREQQVQALSGQLQERGRQLQECDRQLQAILASRTWRLAQALRSLVRLRGRRRAG